jgi:nitroimidazol reductase NimA-like FMN-containing flavoprotein (pyridoxamine 5'-phosphate oxidase superfamily)
MVHAMNKQEIKDLLHELLAWQSLAVLATQASRGPYTTLVGFVATEDLRHIFFVTGRSTRKYASLKAHPNVSMLIDSRTNQASDFRDAVAVTALASAEEIDKEENGDIVALYLAKHPHLEDFVASPGCALIRLRVEKYIVVTRFQQVMTLCLES